MARYVTSVGVGAENDDRFRRTDVQPIWYNLWQKRNWPYDRLSLGDTLYWYVPRRGSIEYHTHVMDVRAFEYSSKSALKEQLKQFDALFDEDDRYDHGAKAKGYCLWWRMESATPLILPKPTDISFPRLGWLPADDPAAGRWLDQAGGNEAITMDDLLPSVPAQSSQELIATLRQPNTANLAPLHLRAIVSRTIRRDTRLIRALKEVCGYRCQFPGCDALIPTKQGRYYVEVHHIEPVRKGGPSMLGNLLVLCPNHHKEFEFGTVIIDNQTPEIVLGNLNGTPFAIALPAD